MYRELWLHPGISALDLMDAVEPTLTAGEAYEAQAWAYKFREL